MKERTLEEIAKELDRVLNLGGRVCEVKVIRNKIELSKYFNAETQKYEKKRITAKQAENTIDWFYKFYNIRREKS